MSSSHLCNILLSVLVLITVASPPSHSQEPEPSDGPEVADVLFDGASFFGTSQLAKTMVTRSTPGFFGRLVGNERQYFREGDLVDDIGRLTELYANHGFFDISIDTSTEITADGDEIIVRFHVREGQQYAIDSVEYRGLNPAPDWIAIHFSDSRLIEPGDPFDRFTLEREAERIVSVAKNSGYAQARFLNDSSQTRVFGETKTCRAVLSFDLGNQFFWGEISVRRDSGSEALRRKDITDDIIFAQLDFESGPPFSQEKLSTSERNLNRLGIFDRAEIAVRLKKKSESSFVSNAEISFIPRDKHEIAPELIVSDQYGVFNLGFGLGYSNRNFLGGARILSTRARFRTQTVGQWPEYFGSDTVSISNAEVTLEVHQPYIFTNKIRGLWAISYVKDKQELSREDILRNQFGFTSQLAEFTRGFLVWSLEWNLARLNDGVQDSLFVQEPQLNSILSFTIERDKSSPVFSPARGFIHSLTLDESGLLPELVGGGSTRLSYTQFYRVIGIGRWYGDLTDHGFVVLGFKLKGAFSGKYGRSYSDPRRQIPLSYRLYGGGGASVRGWRSRDLIAAGDPRFGGNAAFEGSAEFRINPFKTSKTDFLTPIGFVTFFDFGNVWLNIKDMRWRDIALAAGAGIRYDTFFGPFRLDAGFRVYDPGAAPGTEWVTQREFISGLVFHFSIGHAF